MRATLSRQILVEGGPGPIWRAKVPFCCAVRIAPISTILNQSFFSHKRPRRNSPFWNRTGEFWVKSHIKDGDPVLLKKIHVPTPRAAWRWCLGAGTRPPTHLKNAGTPSARVTIVHGTGFWPQTSWVCFLVGKGPQVRGSTQH